MDSSTVVFDELARIEVEAFPESAFEIPATREEATYLVVASNDGGITELHHLMRTGRYSAAGGGSSGLAYLDDICRSGQGVDVDGVLAYYEREGLDLSAALSVDCNLSLGVRRIDRTTGVPWSLHGYSAIFRSLADISAVFAWVNGAAERSLTKVGWVARPFMGRSDICAPMQDSKGMSLDHDWKPSVIYATDNKDVMRAIERTAATPFVPIQMAIGLGAPERSSLEC